jgi:hypothetical protein
MQLRHASLPALGLLSLSLVTALACGTSDGDRTPGGGSCTDCPGGVGGQDGSGAGGTGTGTGATGSGATGSGATGSGGSGTINFGEWNAYVMAGAEGMLASEYTTWKNRHYHTCPDGSASVRTGGGVVSEGIGYGMLITATLGSQADFDGLHKFYNQAAKGVSGLMNWQCGDCGSCGGGGPATDADLDVAMALVQADARWGGYAAAALTVIQNLRKPTVTEVCGAYTVMRPGDHWGGCSDNGLINPSYWAPGYYRVFAQLDPEGAAVWNKLVDDSYTLLEASKGGHPDNLFIWPDAMKWNGSTFLNDKGFSYNGYDACRTPWRIATDYAWTNDSRAQALLAWTSSEVDTRGFSGITNQANSAFYGALALGSIAVSQEKADARLNEWLNSSLDDVPYYQGTLRLLYLMVAAGKFPSTL